MGNVVVAMDLTPANAKKYISGIAQNSNRIFYTKHANQRMKERKITTFQVECCLRHGKVAENPYRDEHGNWMVKLEVLTAGDSVTVVVAIDRDSKGELILVITSYK